MTKYIKLFLLFLLFSDFTAVLYAGERRLNIALIHTFSKADPACYDPYGKNLLHGVEMAWSNFQKKYPNIPFDLNLIQYDISDSRRKTVEMMDKAYSDNVVAAIGYICSDFALLGGMRAQQLGIPVITPSATDDRIAQIGDYVFMGSFTNSYQGEVLAKFAFDDLGKRKTLIIEAVDCPYCISLAGAYRKFFEQNGGTIVAELNILQKDTDFKDVVTETSKYSYDSVLLPNYAMQIAGIIAEMLKFDVNTTFLGGDAWLWTKDAFDVVGDKPFIGYSVTTWLPEYPTKQSKEFVRNYTQQYNDQISDAAAHSYDVATILFNAIKKVQIYDRMHIRDALYKTGTHEGVTGTLKYEGRNHPKRPIMIMKTTNYKQEMLKILQAK